MISLAFAGFLSGLAALSVPVILHFLRHKPTKPTAFPSLHFLKATLARRSANNTLRKWLVLILRCLCLAALVLAFCKPYLPRFADQPDQATVVLWDHSFSMRAAPHEAYLRTECRKQLDQANASHPILFGAVSDKVEWSGKFTGHPAELRHAFESLERPEGTSSFENAVRLADARLALMPGEAKNIVIITDHQALPWKTLRWREKLSPGTQLRVIFPGNNGYDNVAVTDFAPEARYTGAGSKVKVAARIANYSNTARQGALTCWMDGREVDRKEVDLPPRSETVHPFAITGEKAYHGLEVRLDVEDDLSVDNQRWLALNTTPLPVVRATKQPDNQTDFLQIAFNPAPTARSADWRAWDDAETGTTPPDLLIVRDGFSSRSQRGRQLEQILGQGGAAAILWDGSPETRHLLLQYGVTSEMIPKQQTKTLEFIDFDHPVFKPFLESQVGGFFNILFFNPPVLHLPENAQVLAAFNDETPALAEIRVGSGTLFILASGMDRKHTNWPTHATFLPFWRKVLEYSKTEREADQSLFVSATARHLPGLRQATDLASGKEIVVESSRLPARHAGNFLLDAGSNPRVVSINVPLEESNPIQLDADFSHEDIISLEPVQANLAAAALPKDQGNNYWYGLFVVAVLAALAEMLISNRTVL